MKKSLTPFIIIFIFLACQEPREQSSLLTTAFDKKAGAEISMKTAQRWIERYRNDHASRRFDIPGTILSYSEIEQILNEVPDKIGVLFHYAIDDDGRVNTLLIPVRKDNPVWSVTNILNATDGSVLSAADGQALAERFRSSYPDEVRSHFFGIHVFERIYNSIEFVHGTSDDDILQLLLFMRSDNEYDDGRSQEESVTVYDRSIICPPTCDTSEPDTN